MTAFRLPSTGRDEVGWDDALAAVLGYACGTRSLALAERGPLVAESVEVPLSAYRAYDCVPPSPGGFDWLDVLVVDAINGGMDHRAITALMHAARRAAAHVERAVVLAAGTPFWDLDEEEARRAPSGTSVGGELAWAWAECSRTDGVGIALTHKLLHHRRPDLFPLIDGRTRPCLAAHARGGNDQLWAVVHRELTANALQFGALEDAFASLLDGPDDVPLTRLRLHDVLLWLIATDNWDRTVAAGRRTAEWQRWQARPAG